MTNGSSGSGSGNDSKSLRQKVDDLHADNLDDEQLEIFAYLAYHCGLGQGALAQKMEFVNADAATKAWNRKRMAEDVHMMLKREQGKRMRADRAIRSGFSGGE